MSWQETKQEFEIKDGAEVHVKSTKEWKYRFRELFSAKDWIEYSFRLLGLGGLVFSIYFLTQGQRNDIKRQKSVYEFNILMDATSQVYQLKEADKFDSTYIRKSKEFFTLTKPKVNFLRKDSLNLLLDSLEDANKIIIQSYGLIDSVKALRSIFYQFDLLINLKKSDTSELLTYLEIFRNKSDHISTLNLNIQIDFPGLTVRRINDSLNLMFLKSLSNPIEMAKFNTDSYDILRKSIYNKSFTLDSFNIQKAFFYKSNDDRGWNLHDVWILGIGTFKTRAEVFARQCSNSIEYFKE